MQTNVKKQVLRKAFIGLLFLEAGFLLSANLVS
ncbi:hypothetical protein theurythT_23580 [Thalassotalea eurytherma]|uniref:Uncharacterized protein n=1 Tax=Thalassotalea eurytherma TaxID=1144278 RepID=A0ABQ6H7R2_9GAMM|nr:hypothetical protein theurythT_23580 [Thalassotalea eurytherma]